MKIALFLASLALLIGCKAKSNCTDVQNLLDPSNEIRLEAKQMNVAGIAFPQYFEIIGNHCVIIDTKADEFLKLVNMKSNEFLKSFGRKGQGPGEFVYAASILPDRGDKGCFWIYDSQLRRLSKFSIQSLLHDQCLPEKIVKLQPANGGYINQMKIIPGGQLLGVGLFSKGRIAVYAQNGEFIKTIGRLPVEPEKEGQAVNYSHAFMGSMAYRDNSREIFVATRLGTIIEKYDMTGIMKATYIGPEAFFPEFDRVQTGEGVTITYNEKTRNGYLDICYSKKWDKLFLLYSGKYKFDKEGKIQDAGGDIVYIMDSCGAIENKLKLNREIYQLRISDDGRVMYGSSDAGLIQFEMQGGHEGWDLKNH